MSTSREGKVPRRPGRWLLACYTEQAAGPAPPSPGRRSHRAALGLVPGTAQQENRLSLPGYRWCGRPALPAPAVRSPCPKAGAGGEWEEGGQDLVACSFNDFNCQIFSASGWKIVIRAPHTGVSPAGSTLALVNAGTGVVLLGDMGPCRVAGAPRSHPHRG